MLRLLVGGAKRTNDSILATYNITCSHVVSCLKTSDWKLRQRSDRHGRHCGGVQCVSPVKMKK